MARQSTKRPTMSVTADVAALAVADGELHVAVVTRGQEPHKGRFALPGGFVEANEALADAAARELAEETGLTRLSLEQFGAYGDPGRDPRGHTVTVAYLAALPGLRDLEAGDDAAAAQWQPVAPLLKARTKLAFDHRQVLTDAIEAVATKIERTTMATQFVPRDFTLSQLRAVYEAFWGSALDPGNFQRKVLAIDGFVAPTGAVREASGRGRPAATYRAIGRGVKRLSSPISRPGV